MGTLRMNTTDTTFLRIEHYSDHPEVLHAALLLVSRLKDQRTIREEAKYIAAAKKLIASIYVRDELLFRMSTKKEYYSCLLYTSPSPRDLSTSRMPSSA